MTKNINIPSIEYLSTDEVLRGYDKVTSLYPYVPSLSLWRSWECAAYERFQLSGRVLDLGCGDGRYFKLLWPGCSEVIGVEIEPRVAELGKLSGVYKDIHITPAHLIPETNSSFDCVFANCSLEHMDFLEEVLKEINRCLKPGGILLCSVVTNRFLEWSPITIAATLAGYKQAADNLQKNFYEFHHLVNPLTIEGWQSHFHRAGLCLETHIPILPKYNSGIFLSIDSLWHLDRKVGGEMGDLIFPFLSSNSNFPKGFRKIFEGLLEMEVDWLDASGAIFLVRKQKDA